MSCTYGIKKQRETYTTGKDNSGERQSIRARVRMPLNADFPLTTYVPLDSEDFGVHLELCLVFEKLL
jgi:hypothetical protein